MPLVAVLAVSHRPMAPASAPQRFLIWSQMCQEAPSISVDNQAKHRGNEGVEERTLFSVVNEAAPARQN